MSILEPDRITFPDGWPSVRADLVPIRPNRPASPVPARQIEARPLSISRQRFRWFWRRDIDWVTVLIYGLVTACVVLAVWTLVLVVQAAIALAVAVGTWLAGHWPLIVLAVLGLALLLLAGSGTRCRGLHCGGCRH